MGEPKVGDLVVILDSGWKWWLKGRVAKLLGYRQEDFTPGFQIYLELVSPVLGLFSRCHVREPFYHKHVLRKAHPLEALAEAGK